MHVVMLSDAETQGGAGTAASRLADGLAEAGHRVTRLVSAPDRQEHAWETVALDSRRLHRRTLRRFGAADRIVGRVEGHRFVARTLDILQPDVINVHNVHGTSWGPEVVEVCAARAPTVWTLHDTWSYTGRCTYTYDCQKFIKGCDSACPTAGERPSLPPRLIGPAWAARRAMLLRWPHLTAVSPSEWLAGQARRGIWRDNPVAVIPNGVPLHSFRVIDKVAARRTLGLPPDKPVILAVAQALDERRKGMRTLLEALEGVEIALDLLTLGNGAPTSPSPSVRVVPLGFVEDEHVRRAAYNAADILVHPAPVDNLPNAVLEAMACGTPTVSFAIGGLPEMVRPGLTGWLAPGLSPAALRATVLAALAAVRQDSRYRSSCRAVAESEYTVDLQASRYVEAYANLAASWSDPRGQSA